MRRVRIKKNKLSFLVYVILVKELVYLCAFFFGRYLSVVLLELSYHRYLCCFVLYCRCAGWIEGSGANKAAAEMTNKAGTWAVFRAAEAAKKVILVFRVL